MPKWLKYTLAGLGGLVGLLALLLGGAAIYISSHKQQVVDKVVKGINNKISGQLSFNGISTSVLKNFPNIAVSLNNVELKDSLWATHKHSLLKAKELSLVLNLPSVIKGNVEIDKLGLEDATVYIYKNPQGYSNTWLGKNIDPKKRDTLNSNPFKDFKIGNFDLYNVRFVINNSQKNKLFNFNIKEVEGRLKFNGRDFAGNVNLDLVAEDFSFNTARGSFMKGRQIKGVAQLAYTDTNSTLNFPGSKLTIGGDDFEARGRINMASTPTKFELFITAPHIIFGRAAALMANNIRPKLEQFKIEKPVKVSCDIIERALDPTSDPLITVKMPVRDNTLLTPAGDLYHATFDGEFKNQVKPDQPIGDPNSYIALKSFKGDYFNVPLTIAQLLILNLEKPVAHGQVKSAFNLTRLNSSVKEADLRFNTGTAALDLSYSADIENLKFVKPSIVGTVRVNNAGITYLPRKLTATNTSFELNFGKEDLSFHKAHFQVGKSVLNADMFIKNFLNFYYTDPNKVVADVTVSSPKLDLTQIAPAFSGRGGKNAPKRRNKVTSFAEQLTDVLQQARVNLKMNVANATYKRFTATNLAADIALINDGVLLRKLHVNHAGGQLNLTGAINPEGTTSTFNVTTTLKNASVKDFFYEFENFGMKELTSENLTGRISVDARLKGKLTGEGTLAKRSLSGTASFNLADASLLNFKPLVNISKFIFRNRNLDNVQFKTLAGKLDINGEKINIAPMQVNSSAINMDVKGVYSLGSGTNILIDVPLRNPKKDELIEDPTERKEKRMKGLIIHLNAVDGADGKIKLKKSLGIN